MLEATEKYGLQALLFMNHNNDIISKEIGGLSCKFLNYGLV